MSFELLLYIRKFPQKNSKTIIILRVKFDPIKLYPLVVPYFCYKCASFMSYLVDSSIKKSMSKKEERKVIKKELRKVVKEELKDQFVYVHKC